MRGFKTGNEYAAAFGRLYAKTPKSVFAAVAYSYTSSGGENTAQGIANFMEEWRILHENGIVSQRPPTRFATALAIARKDEPLPRGPQ